MKILVVSLLRLGDIIQQEPLLRGLREKYPEAEIHLLLNKQFASIEKVLAGVVDRYFSFDRESLQKGLGEAEFNIMWSYDQLATLVSQLNEQKYDQILNFTHNKLSAYLIGAIEATNKKGLYQEQGQFHGLENRWLRYFNDRFSGTNKSLFHYVELLGSSFDIPLQLADLQKVGSQKKKSKLILFQCLTSDTKKNWGLENFQQLKRIIERALVDYQVKILGAAFEREQLSQFFSEKDLLICDLAQAQAHLQEATLLVTGDTSIKHLAAQSGVSIVEIAIGSSDAMKTAAYSKDSQILSSSVPCAPCHHSQACSQKSHLCAEDVDVEKVFATVWDQLSGEEIKKIFTTHDLDRLVWTQYLDVKKAIQIKAAPMPVFADKDFLITSHQKTKLFKTWLEQAEKALPSRESLLAKKVVSANEWAGLILLGQDILRSKQDEAGYFQNFLESLTGRFAHSVQIYDRIYQSLSEARELTEIRVKLIRYLETSLVEGSYYAAGIGQLSIGGFEETRASLSRTDESTSLRRRSREVETFE